MDLYKEILAHALIRGEIQITFSGQDLDLAEILEEECYRALRKIKEIICDDSLDDQTCFTKIEAIVCALEDIGSSGGSRHDFG